MEIGTFLTQHSQRWLDELVEFLEIPSISADSTHGGDVRQAAEWLCARMGKAGLEDTRVLETGGHPAVFAASDGEPEKPTLLLYGHYDVQPVDPVDLWENPPFTPEIREGRIYARGVSDTKGSVLAAVQAWEAVAACQAPRAFNVKFLIEGEEEIGSPSFLGCLHNNKSLLACDLAVNVDSGQYSEDQPAIIVGLKGWCGIQIHVRTAAYDFHSGLMGGIAPNANHVLSHILASMVEFDGTVAVEGFYDQVRPLSDEDRQAIARIPDETAKHLRQTGVSQPVGEPGFSPRERNWARPTFDVNGMGGGFQGEGVKTVIPCTAQAKVTCRLVADQDPAVVRDALIAHVHKHSPAGVSVTVEPFPMLADPVTVAGDHPMLARLETTLQAHYGRTPYRIRVGGSVAALGMIQQVLGTAAPGLGFAQMDENAHAPNEFMRLSNLQRARAVYASLFSE